MKKITLLIYVFLLPLISFSQQEKYPTFVECKEEILDNSSDCFYKKTKEIFTKSLKSL